MAWAAIATASRARAGALQSSKAIWWAARSSVPIRLPPQWPARGRPQRGGADHEGPGHHQRWRSEVACGPRSDAERPGRPTDRPQVDGGRRPLGEDRGERRGADALVEADTSTTSITRFKSATRGR